jgi:hypothetical protein
MYAGQPGASGSPGQIATFDSYQDGYNALVNQLALYANGTCAACKGMPQTITGTFAIYAPAGSGNNNPTVYAQNVANALGVDPNTPLASVLVGSADSFSVPDLSSIGLPGVSFDPTMLAVGGLIVGFVLLMLLRR